MAAGLLVCSSWRTLLCQIQSVSSIYTLYWRFREASFDCGKPATTIDDEEQTSQTQPVLRVYHKAHRTKRITIPFLADRPPLCLTLIAGYSTVSGNEVVERSHKLTLWSKSVDCMVSYFGDGQESTSKLKHHSPSAGQSYNNVSLPSSLVGFQLPPCYCSVMARKQRSYEVVMLGDPEVGKTALVLQVLHVVLYS